MNKVLLILADGMRPDSLAACQNPYVDELLKHGKYDLNAKTVMPSVTLPCHMSLFHSVDPDRHGILTNTYVPQVRPVRGICEVLHDAQKNCAMFFNWEPLRDLTRPGSLAESYFTTGYTTAGYEGANAKLVDALIPYLRNQSADFTFLYFGWPDAAGHDKGWMGEEYLRSVSGCFDQMKKVISTLGEDYLVVITADHGGHGRGHGADIPEDMTIPVLFYNPKFKSERLSDVSILDLAPTITAVLGVEKDRDWDGKVLDIRC